ncbi:hypothetical protein J4449_02440 [Candidatus Woesearchaeota archaeon]|nr:hypothetical protein [Candidatus Woesearchaeota archaeon]
MKLICSLFFVILLSLSIAFGANSLNLELEKNVYGPFSELKGMCTLKLDDSLDLGLEQKIKISIGDRKEERDALSILIGLDPDLDIQESSIELGNSASQKTFDLSATSLLGIKLPKGSEVSKIDFDVEGVSNNGYPSSPFIDFNNDDKYEWYYKGIFTGWSNEIVNAKGLNENGASEDIIVRDNIFLYCNIIDLPYSNKFNVSAKYTVGNTGGNISMQIFEFDQEVNSAYGKKGDCLLKNAGRATESSCVIETDSFLSGEHLLCFYNSKNEGSYFLNLDRDGEGSFECDSAILDGEEQCNYLQEGDFFFKVYKPNFQGEFNRIGKFSEFGKAGFEDDLNDYLADCEEDENDDCNIILKIGSENRKGKARLSNLNIEYSKSGGASFITRKIYDVEFVNAKLLGVLGEDFNNYTLNIPLEVFDNLTVPNITANVSTRNVQINLGNLNDQENIQINKNIISSAQSEIDSLRLKLESLKNKNELSDFFRISGIDLEKPINRMRDFKINLDAVNNNLGLGIGERSTEAEKIIEQAKTYTGTFPKEIDIIEDISYPRVYPENIKPEILGRESQESILALQEEVDIDNKIKVVLVKNFDGTTSEKTLIKRTLSSNLGEYFVFEDIPKSVAASAGAIKLSSGASVVKDDPIIKWRVNGNGEIGYLIEGNALGEISEIKTIVVSSESPLITEEFGENSCGDGICTEILEDKISCPEDCTTQFNINWQLVIVLIIILILGLLYFNFFMGKKSLKEIVIKKYPFLSNTDEANLKNFISKSIAKGVPRSTIYKILLQKKWTKEQIDYVFKKVQPPKAN